MAFSWVSRSTLRLAARPTARIQIQTCAFASQPERLPYKGVRVLEKGNLLSGRLAGLLFADQGAEVLVLDAQEGGHTDSYLNRNKVALSSIDAISAASADIIIVDGNDESIPRLPHQIMLRTTAAIPGDPVFGHLPDDIDEDYLSAIVGFFTDMDMMGWLDRPVTYTPLKLCSIYAGVIGANATAAALVDRLRCGEGRELHTSRLAGGLSAIGALCLRQTGLPAHLNPAPAIYKSAAEILDKRKGLEAEQLQQYKEEAMADPARQAWLFQRLYPFMAPYKCKDGEWILPMATFNRKLAVSYCNYLGFMPQVKDFGIVDKDPYDPDNMPYDDRNLALPMGFNFASSSHCAQLFEETFLQKTAAEWEAQLEASGLPCAKIQSWEDWLNDPDAKRSRVVATVDGEIQLGRTAWLRSAGDYPDLRGFSHGAAIPKGEAKTLPSAAKPKLPLEGYVICDFANVIAGPACGRMFAELGATVYKLGPGLPQHGPMVMMVWQAELHQGKQSIILDAKKPAGKEVIQRAIAKADLVLVNKMDNQLASLGLNRESLDVTNPKAVLVQLKSHQGERYSERSNWNGYDPALQGKTGLMTRFGPEGCPNFHGVASCVDYLTGYMAMWGGLAALYSRDERQSTQGDWAVTSLATCASLTQLTLQKGLPLPPTAVGCNATGMTPHARVWKVRGKDMHGAQRYVYGQAAAGADLAALEQQLTAMSVEEAVSHFQSQFSSLAVQVNTVKEIAELCSDGTSTTANFKAKDAGQGWHVHTWEPTWFCIDGQPLSCPGAPTFSGSDAEAVLKELGYSKTEVMGLQQSRAVVPTNWYKWSTDDKAQVEQQQQHFQQQHLSEQSLD